MLDVEEIGPVRKFRMGRSCLGRTLYFTTAYELDGLLVDTGCRHTVSELVTALEGTRVHTVVNTHSHEDHVAGNAELQQRHGSRILAHPLAIPVLGRPPNEVDLQPYRLVMWGVPEPSRAETIGEVLVVGDYRFEVLFTPGHSPDHIALYEPRKRWLFSGDLFIGGRDRALRADYDIWGIIESLRRVANLDVSVLFPASGSVRRDPRNEFLAKIEYLEELGGKVLDLRDQGLSRAEICRSLLPRPGWISYLTLGHFSGMGLVRSFLEWSRPGDRGRDL